MLDFMKHMKVQILMHIRLLLMKKNHHLWSASSSVPTSGDEPILCLFLFLRFFQDVSSAFTWLFEENSCFFSPDLRNHQFVKVRLRIGLFFSKKLFFCELSVRKFDSCNFTQCFLTCIHTIVFLHVTMSYFLNSCSFSL
jgi:hypothetical protein